MFNMTQAEQDYLIIKSLIGDDLDRMSNLIIEMQKGYQTFFKESQKENRETISNLSSLVAHQCSMKDLEILDFLKVLQANKDLILEKVSDAGDNTEIVLDKIRLQTYSGICGNVWNTLSYKHDFNTAYYESWKHYSGDTGFPISGEDVYTSLGNYWAGDQGKLRFDLIDHLVKCYSRQLGVK